MEDSPLLRSETRHRRVWHVLVVVLSLAVIGLTAGVIVLATRDGGSSTDAFAERCMYSDELGALKNETSGMFRENRNRLTSLFLSNNDTELIYLRGGSDIIRNDDVTYLFRQESNFIYLTGVDFEDAHLIIHPQTGYSVLFIERRDTSYAVWNGIVLSPNEIRLQYDLDEVLYADELEDYLLAVNVSVIYTIPGTVFPLANFTEVVNTSYLNGFLIQARRVKSEKELKVLMFVNYITSHAHEYAMRKCATKLREGYSVTEYDLESYFLHSTYNCESRLQAYTSIVGAGSHGSILHYIANDAQVQPDDIILMDAGAELWGYGADVTRTFPANGKFTSKQEKIYDIVLKAQTETALLLRDGVLWSDLNNRSRIVITEELMNANFINGTFEDLWANAIYQYFYPHGIGHSLGLDVHDSDFSGSTPILSGAFLTIEPGVYFNQALLDTVRNNTLISQYFVWSNIDEYLDFGGVRIEDDYIVNIGGFQKVTSVPSTVSDLQKLLSKDI